MGVKRRGLTREIVVKAAAEMADKAGDPQAVTLTALAQALNVRTPSLYNHIGGSRDLQEAMALYGLTLLSEDLQKAIAGVVGREALMATAYAYRNYARRHPGIYPLTTQAPDPEDSQRSAVAAGLVQMFLLLLASMGIEGDDALHAVRGLRALLHGFVSLEAAEGFKMALDREESFRRAAATYLDGLSCERAAR